MSYCLRYAYIKRVVLHPANYLLYLWVVLTHTVQRLSGHARPLTKQSAKHLFVRRHCCVCVSRNRCSLNTRTSSAVWSSLTVIAQSCLGRTTLVCSSGTCRLATWNISWSDTLTTSLLSESRLTDTSPSLVLHGVFINASVVFACV